MEITAKMVKELREKTNAGMMDCKNALTSTAGDMEKAKDWLRERGLATVGKRAGRVAKEGVIATAVSASGKQAAILELNTETDFVAKTDGFVALANEIAKHLADTPEIPESLDALLGRSCGNALFGTLITDNTAKTGEKSELRRYKVIKAENDGFVHAYNHAGGKLAVIVSVSGGTPGDAAEQAAHELAMQIAAHAPQAIEIKDVDPKDVERESNIYKELVKNSGKPEKIWPKIIEGYLNNYYKQVVLLEQPYIKEPKLSVKAWLNSLKGTAGQLAVVAYERYQLAEELAEPGA
ncbi:MAG: translation elongation factor Ts [Deltaproteobacteria bacterium]|jgi:elongation factor Ts|nr:translation elongation factor Ts [Deltaproteobacteria bacterium]